MTCPQLEDNQLYIGPTTSNQVSGLPNQRIGLFTRKNRAVGSVLCIKIGIKIKDFWNFTDYDISSIRSIDNNFLDNDYDNISYADFFFEK